MTPQREIFPWFIGTWIVLGILYWSTYYDRNVARKKRLLPVFIIGSHALVVIFLLTPGLPVPVLAFAVPGVVLICILNLRMSKVCSACGRVIQRGLWFKKDQCCDECRARLD